MYIKNNKFRKVFAFKILRAILSSVDTVLLGWSSSLKRCYTISRDVTVSVQRD